MSWLRIDDGFTEHGKLVELKRADRWTWMEVLTYCARQGKDGEVPRGIVDVLRWVTPAFLDRCVELGLLDLDDDGRLTVHNWPKYNPRDALKADRQARWRANRDARVDDPVDAAVDADVDVEASTRIVYGDGPSRAGQRARGPSRPVLSSSPTTSSDLRRANDDDDELVKRLDALTPSTQQRLRWTLALLDDPGLVERQLDAAVLNGRNPAALFDDLVQRNVDPGATNAPQAFTYPEPDPDTVAADSELLEQQGPWVSAEDEMRKRVADLQAQVAERRAGR